MIGNQLHQFAHDEHNYVKMSVGGAGVKPLSAVDTDDRFFITKTDSCLLMFPFSLPGHNSFSSISFPRMPPLPSCDSPTLNADLFCNKTRCIQGPPFDVAVVIVLHKSGTDTDLRPQWRSDGKKEEAKEWRWIKIVDWHCAFKIIFDQS